MREDFYMKATHKFTNRNGHTFIGVIISNAFANGVWFLPMCNDHKTWMKEPVLAIGVLPL